MVKLWNTDNEDSQFLTIHKLLISEMNISSAQLNITNEEVLPR
jgi:hypothetical protein